MSQPKVKEIISITYRKVISGIGDGKNQKKLLEITNTTKGINLFIWLPSCVKTNIKIPIARFGLILAQDNSPFSQESIVEWLTCTKNTIDVKSKPQNGISNSFTRHGMIKWTQANNTSSL
ncbi:MAG: hypothetical protein KME29_23675 [Calothrix sp. FI2-JRJ7]|jgi:hypothetical protein|nr:hypothetical protein [Calothrix sp. FI2-JRJ7]